MQLTGLFGGYCIHYAINLNYAEMETKAKVLMVEMFSKTDHFA